ncbi:trans-sulfuration enzyme family protein [Streptomonospora litoralis]|nr:PLP-dependent aspartate aminotransferase family protein [Streptomonospora litoralis]
MGAWDGPESGHGSISPPVFQTSLFAKPSFRSFVEQQAQEDEYFVYSRGTNPTVAFLEERLALLEGGAAAKCFASGMGAISALLTSRLRQGDHVLFVNHVYGPTLELAEHLGGFGIEHSVVTGEAIGADASGIEEHIRANTALIYAESPGTMRMQVLDLAAIARIARRHGIATAVDNTWSTPLFQKPMAAGIDIVVHSLTKYIGGHSDVVGGVVVASKPVVRDLFYKGHQLLGAVMSALEASMVLRGLRTLPVRMAEHQRSAEQVIDFLTTRPEVEAVHHPYHDHRPDEPVVRDQFSGFSGLLSFDLKDGTFDRVARFLDSLSLFRIGVSWGGYESLATSPLRPGNEDDLRAKGFSTGLIRLSVGLEGAENQIDDLERAFDKL